eukprot:59112-Prymnesium_polylepis.1
MCVADGRNPPRETGLAPLRRPGRRAFRPLCHPATQWAGVSAKTQKDPARWHPCAAAGPHLRLWCPGSGARRRRRLTRPADLLKRSTEGGLWQGAARDHGSMVRAQRHGCVHMLTKFPEYGERPRLSGRPSPGPSFVPCGPCCLFGPFPRGGSGFKKRVSGSSAQWILIAGWSP